MHRGPAAAPVPDPVTTRGECARGANADSTETSPCDDAPSVNRTRYNGSMTTVHVRLFAGLSQLVGERELEMRLPDGATIDQLRDTLGEQYPIVQAFLPTLVCAVGEEYVPGEHILHDGDAVALIPPVSGG